MLKRYKTVLQYAHIENVIEKSRFIGYVKPIEAEEEAVKFIEGIKTLHKDATHNVPVYLIGKNSEIQRYSDDGEPAGTAGVPILDMLKKEDIKNIVVVVTRYFGGIKLGTGGLVRAYTSTAKLALNEAKVIEKVLHTLVKVRMDYHYMGKVQKEIIDGGFYMKEIQFDDAVNMFVYVESDKVNELINSIMNLTSGKSKVFFQKTIYLNMFNGEILKETASKIKD